MTFETLTKKNATEYVHRWATGYQILIFETEKRAMIWAAANRCEYRK